MRVVVDIKNKIVIGVGTAGEIKRKGLKQALIESFKQGVLFDDQEQTKEVE